MPIPNFLSSYSSILETAPRAPVTHIMVPENRQFIRYLVAAAMGIGVCSADNCRNTERFRLFIFFGIILRVFLRASMLQWLERQLIDFPMTSTLKLFAVRMPDYSS
jgi:hypothetical protein